MTTDPENELASSESDGTLGDERQQTVFGASAFQPARHRADADRTPVRLQLPGVVDVELTRVGQNKRLLQPLVDVQLRYAS